VVPAAAVVVVVVIAAMAVMMVVMATMITDAMHKGEVAISACARLHLRLARDR
jgi:hypothetical protein